MNLYPFEATVAKAGATHEEIVENIDIGGPSMVRSAAKNHALVAIVCDPAAYGAVLEEIEKGGEVSAATSARLAAKAFAHTAAYYAAISGYLSSRAADGTREAYPQYLTLPFEKAYAARSLRTTARTRGAPRAPCARASARAPRVPRRRSP